jgi:ATP-dependent 26S proteasome regulatory subunit
MDIHSAMSMSKFTMLQNIRTGNIIIDTLFAVFLVFIIDQVILNTRSINLKRIKHMIFTNKNVISFECSRTHTFRGKSVLDSSETFKSLLHYIKNNLKNGNTKDLHALSEYHTNEFNEYDYENESENNKEKNKITDTLYFTNQYSSFKISNELTNDVYFDMCKYKAERNEKQRDYEPQYKYTLTLYSYKKSLLELQNIVDMIHKEYCKYIDDKYNKNVYIFMYMGIDPSNNIKYKSYPFHTTCDIDKVYFNNKDKIMNQIKFFINNKDWYTNKGKPYTLGICTHGPPGCGKTSFEKALAKKLNKHLIIVDFSRIKTQNEADEIFFSETINDKKIPYDKRIYLFPDIDRMTNILHKKEKSHQDTHQVPHHQTQLNVENGNHMLKSFLNTTENGGISLMKPKESTADAPLNLSKILNILDGIPERTGQIVIMSTNNPTLLDDALLRPGRVDCMIEFKRASSTTAKKIILNFFENITITSSDEMVFRKIHEKYTPAEIFKKCSEATTFKALLRAL